MSGLLLGIVLSVCTCWFHLASLTCFYWFWNMFIPVFFIQLYPCFLAYVGVFIIIIIIILRSTFVAMAQFLFFSYSEQFPHSIFHIVCACCLFGLSHSNKKLMKLFIRSLLWYNHSFCLFYDTVTRFACCQSIHFHAEESCSQTWRMWECNILAVESEGRMPGGFPWVKAAGTWLLRSCSAEFTIEWN